MDQREAEEIYLHNVNRIQHQLDELGDNPQKINAFITNTYATLAQEDPSFIWFSLGTLVSGTVGKNIQTATQIIINSANQEPSSKIVLTAFSTGNKNIFKSILSIYLTYKSIGMEGVILLKNSEMKKTPYANPIVFDAIEKHSLLLVEQSKIANSLSLPLNDAKVIEKLFSDKNNIKLIHDVAMGIANEEQQIVQNIYRDEFVKIIKDPTLGWIGGQLKLDEINILDKPYKFSEFIDNPADFDQRMAFAEILLNTMEDSIANGQFEKNQANVLQMAEHTLWMANPHTTHNTIGGVNGIYWGQQAEEHDEKLKALVLAFLNPEQLEMPIVSNPIEGNENDIFASIFSGEHEIVKINMDPLALFLANNPNYEVIAHDFAELWASNDYLRTPLQGGMAFWNPNIPFLQNSTYLALYQDGEYHYYQPYGEVRGITFPFIYDKITGIPLTKPILDSIGHYDHTSTTDTLYTDPTAFNKPSHIHWYNPYWNHLVAQAQAEATKHYFKTITVDNFMNSVLAPPTTNISYYNASVQVELKNTDIFHNGSNYIDFSSLNGIGSSAAIVGMTLANGMNLEADKSGNFVCTNCNHDALFLEQAANAMIHQI